METTVTENTSGKGKYVEVPKEVSKWNWGAFFLTWIWGLANGLPIALLVFVPLVGIFMPFYLGAVGSELAWRNKYWHDTKDFQTTQKKWAIAGIIVAVLSLALFSFNLINKIQDQKNDNQMAEQIYEMVIENSGAMKIIGEEPAIATNLGESSVEIGEKTISKSYKIIIKSKNGLFTARANFENEKITDIEIIEWDTNTEQPKSYKFNP